MRRLGVGGDPVGPRRRQAQLVVAIMALAVLVGVPLFLIRRPTTSEAPPAASASTRPAMPEASAVLPPLPDAGAPWERLTVSTPARVMCGQSPRRPHEGSPCDALPAIEEQLARAVRESPECAPRQAQKEQGTINYVLGIDFPRGSATVFAGQTGSWRGPQARRSAQCVQRKLGKLPLAAQGHQHRYYQIAVLATYRPPRAGLGAPGTPSFE